MNGFHVSFISEVEETKLLIPTPPPTTRVLPVSANEIEPAKFNPDEKEYEDNCYR